MKLKSSITKSKNSVECLTGRMLKDKISRLKDKLGELDKQNK